MGLGGSTELRDLGPFCDIGMDNFVAFLGDLSGSEIFELNACTLVPDIVDTAISVGIFLFCEPVGDRSMLMRFGENIESLVFGDFFGFWW